MKTFRDNEQREWCVSLNIAQARKLRDKLDLDVLDPRALQELAGDPYIVANALFVLCERQAQEKGISDEQFGAALAGDAIEAAVTALLEELIDFFPSRQREALRKILATLNQAKSETVTLAEKKLDSPEMKTAMATMLTTAEAEIDAELARLTAGNSSGNAPASLV